MSLTTPHYVREYRRYVSHLLKRRDLNQDEYDDAMARSVGGAFEEVGEAERSAFLALGLKPGDHVVDVGCVWPPRHRAAP